MSTSPTPSQLPNATANTRGAVPHLDRGWSLRGSLITPRQFIYTDFPIQASDGRLVVAGGGAGAVACATAEILTPDAKTSTALPNTSAARSDGYAGARVGSKIAIIGGTDANTGNTALDVVEIFDTGSLTWTTVAAYPSGLVTRGGAIALNNGKILMAGGVSDFIGGLHVDSQLLDPVAGTWSATGNLNIARSHFPPIVRISPDKVLIVCGSVDPGSGPSGPFTAERYSESSTTWALTTGAPAFSRTQHTVTVLANGKVLVVGGSTNTGLNSEVEVYDPNLDTFATVAPLNYGRYNHGAVAMENGQVLVFGGVTFSSIDLLDLPTEIYDPVADKWTVLGTGAEKTSLFGQDGTASGRLFGTHNFDGIYAMGGFNSGFLGTNIDVYGAAAPIMGELTASDAFLTGNQVFGQTLGRKGDAILVRGFSSEPVQNPYNFGVVVPYITNTSILFRARETVSPQMLTTPRNLIQNGGMDFWQRGPAITTVTHVDGPGTNTWSRSGADRWVMAITDYNINASGSAATFQRESTVVDQFVGWDDTQFVLPFQGNMAFTSLPYPPINLIFFSPGSCSFVNGSPIVTGTGTQFLTQAVAGKYVKLYFDSNSFFVQIFSVDSDTQLTLVAPYGGSTADTYGVQADATNIAQGEWALTQEIDRELVLQARGKNLRPDFRMQIQGSFNAVQLQFRLRLFTSDNPTDLGQPLKLWVSPTPIYDQFMSGFTFMLIYGGGAYWQDHNTSFTRTDLIGADVIAMAIQLEVIYDTTYIAVGDGIKITQFTLRDDSAFYDGNNVYPHHPDFQYSAYSKAAEYESVKKYIETNVMDPDIITAGTFKNCISNAANGITYVPFGNVPKWQGSGAPVMSIFSPATGASGSVYDQVGLTDLPATVDGNGLLTSGTVNPVALNYLIDAEFPF